MQAEAAVGMEQTGAVDGRRRQRVVRTAARWAKIIEAQRQSDQTVAEFCRQLGIVRASFWYWNKRLASNAEQERVAKPEHRFLTVPIVTPVEERIEVDLGSMRVRLDGAAAARVVEAIVARVGSVVQS